MSVATLNPPGPEAALSPLETYLQPWDAGAPSLTEDGEPAWLKRRRQEGRDRFAALGFPTLRHEDWRATNIEPITRLAFAPVRVPEAHEVTAAALRALPLADAPGGRLVFVDGHFEPRLSQLGEPRKGGVVTSLARAVAEGLSVVEAQLGRCARGGQDPFLALNDAYFTDGGLVHVPAGAAWDDPVHLVYVSTHRTPGRAAHPRTLVVVERGGACTVCEHHVGVGATAGLTNAVTEVVAAEDARVEHVRFQDEVRAAYHVGAVHVALGRGTQLRSHSLAFGARLSRVTLGAGLHGEGAEAVLNGLYLAQGSQCVDHHMTVEHAQPHGASHEYFNGILADQAKGVFRGRILVQPGAQKTDAKQTNKNILLSDEAMVDTRPQLEIYADDVKCTHGATIGQLEAEAVFYLRARGIPHEMARRMLIHSFAGEITARVASRPMREALDRLVWDRLEQDEHVHLGGEA